MRFDPSSMRIAAALLFLSATGRSVAARLTPWIAPAGLSVAITQATLPRTLRSDLSSGLTNRIAVQVALFREGARISEKMVEVAVKYDLWDETYRMTVSLEGSLLMGRTYRHVEDVTDALLRLQLPGIFATRELPDTARLRLTVTLTFDPIEKAQLKELRQWVRENTAPAAPNVTELGPGVAASPPTSQEHSLFDRIFEQYARGDTIAGSWHDSGTSSEFELRDLPQEPPP